MNCIMLSNIYGVMNITTIVIATHYWRQLSLWSSFKQHHNTLASGYFRVLSGKNTETHVALRRNFSGPVCSTNPVKVSKDAASL